MTIRSVGTWKIRESSEISVGNGWAFLTTENCTNTLNIEDKRYPHILIVAGKSGYREDGNTITLQFRTNECCVRISNNQIQYMATRSGDRRALLPQDIETVGFIIVSLNLDNPEESWMSCMGRDAANFDQSNGTFGTFTAPTIVLEKNTYAWCAVSETIVDEWKIGNSATIINDFFNSETRTAKYVESTSYATPCFYIGNDGTNPVTGLDIPLEYPKILWGDYYLLNIARYDIRENYRFLSYETGEKFYFCAQQGISIPTAFRWGRYTGTNIGDYTIRLLGPTLEIQRSNEQGTGYTRYTVTTIQSFEDQFVQMYVDLDTLEIIYSYGTNDPITVDPGSINTQTLAQPISLSNPPTLSGPIYFKDVIDAHPEVDFTDLNAMRERFYTGTEYRNVGVNTDRILGFKPSFGSAIWDMDILRLQSQV